MTDRETQGDRAAVAAPDCHRRRRLQGVQEGRGILGLLAGGGALVGWGQLGAAVAAAIVGEHAAPLGERGNGVTPDDRRAARAVYAEERRALAVLLVVEPNAVHGGLGH